MKALLTIGYLATTVVAMGDMLKKPHKAHTMNMMLCIPEVDMVACSKTANDEDAADIMYMDNGDRMI